MSRGLLGLCAAAVLAATTAQARQPIVAVLAQNSGTEITDFLVPYGVIAASGAADVQAVSTEDGTVKLWPGLMMLADTTIEKFDAVHPEGADFVIVPAFHDSSYGVTRDWLRAQAAKGATLVSICDGALALAGTGLLDGHSATGHFYSAEQRRRAFPNVHWVTNTRFVHDGKFISSSGVSASLPTALYIVELLAGRTRALEVAQAQGVPDYSATHDSDAFHVGTAEYWIGARNFLFGWPRDVYAVELVPDVDEVALGFAFDMLSRTYYSHALAVAPAVETTTRHGLRVLRAATPDEVAARAIPVRIGAAAGGGGLTVAAGARAADDVLAYLTARYGRPVSAFVAMQLEYPTTAPETHAAARYSGRSGRLPPQSGWAEGQSEK